jgi:hypothetical protein
MEYERVLKSEYYRQRFLRNGLFAAKYTGTRVGFLTAKTVQRAKFAYITYAHFTGPRIVTPNLGLVGARIYFIARGM